MRKIEICIADGHYLTLQGMEVLVNESGFCELTGIAHRVNDLGRMLHKLRPDVLILDYDSMEFPLEDVGKIRKFSPVTKILGITQELSGSTYQRALKYGVLSHVLKWCSRQEISDAILSTSRGKAFYCGKVLDKLMKESTEELQLHHLPSNASCDPVKISSREAEIIRLISTGLTTKQIANKLFLSPHTVSTHRKNIMGKIGVNNTAGIVRYALKENLLSTL